MSIIQNSAYCYFQNCLNDKAYNLFVIVQTKPGFEMITPSSPSAVYSNGIFRVVIKVKQKDAAIPIDHYFGPIPIADQNMNIQSDVIRVWVEEYQQDGTTPITRFDTHITIADADQVEECITGSSIAHNCPHLRLLHTNDGRNSKKSKCVIPVKTGIFFATENLVKTRSNGSTQDDILTSNIELSGNVVGANTTQLIIPSTTNVTVYTDDNTDNGHFEATVSLNGKIKKGRVRNANSTIQPGPAMFGVGSRTTSPSPSSKNEA